MAVSSLLAASVLTVLKLVVGITTFSLGILAEAAHSGLDLLAAGVTLWAIYMSSRPADRKQTYGYGKFENLSALFETLLLLVTCLWIVYEASRRLFFAEQVEVDPSLWAFLVVILSIVVDFTRSRALLRVAKKYHSQALEADALHFSTDIWSSCVVLFGLFGVLVAQHFDLPWLARADTFAALAVAGIIVWVSLKLGKKSVDDLLDRIPDDLRDKVAHAAGQVSGVESVTKVRMRRAGSEVFADITLSVGHTISFERAHEVADEAAEAVRTVVPGADVVVHAEPLALSDHDITTQVRILAARRGFRAMPSAFTRRMRSVGWNCTWKCPSRLRSTTPIARRLCSRMTCVPACRGRCGSSRTSNRSATAPPSSRPSRPMRRKSWPWSTISCTAMVHRAAPQRQGPASRRADSGFLPLSPRSADADRRRSRSDRGPGGPHPRPRAECGAGGDSRRAEEGRWGISIQKTSPQKNLRIDHHPASPLGVEPGVKLGQWHDVDVDVLAGVAAAGAGFLLRRGQRRASRFP